MSFKQLSGTLSRTQKLTRGRHSVAGPAYGRTHLVSKTPNLPNPVVPTYPQTVFLSDGSSFTHRTTTPRSIVRLTRDITNNPVWQPGQEARAGEEEDLSGRLGRYKRRFEESQWGEGELEGLMDQAKGSSKDVDKMRDGKPKHK
ncbi:hypothetical protein BDV93DRAFT_501441 [Ceratobasidium sp. AG-I]|nr:hypothetical protein BDV93DRAFT_501441 [Ceratobasidium sp. AG-I]